MMFSMKRLVVLAMGLAGFVSAISSTGNSVLVVVESSKKDNFSIFFDDLRSALVVLSVLCQKLIFFY